MKQILLTNRCKSVFSSNPLRLSGFASPPRKVRKLTKNLELFFYSKLAGTSSREYFSIYWKQINVLPPFHIIIKQLHLLVSVVCWYDVTTLLVYLFSHLSNILVFCTVFLSVNKLVLNRLEILNGMLTIIIPILPVYTLLTTEQ